MIYRLWISQIWYGTATIQANSEEEAVKKFYDVAPPIDYHSEEYSDVTAEPIPESESEVNGDEKN